MPSEGSSRPTVAISDELADRMREIFAEDVALLRRYMPPDFDGWGLG
jgi:hypothetical protein